LNEKMETDMTSRIVKNLVGAALAGGALFGAAGAASAHDQVGLSLSIGAPVAVPPHVVYAPPPAYYPPQVAYYPPGYYRPGWVWVDHHWVRREQWREHERREREWHEYHR
jgi:hypothetical protein